jgi:uncharacterized integral membrane protein
MTETSPNRPTPMSPGPTNPAVAHGPIADTTPETTPIPRSTRPGEASTPSDSVRHTRTSRTWIGIIVFALLLVLLLVFILQNTQSVEISYFGFSGTVPLAVAMLLSAVAGVLLTAIAGSLRIWQLRRHLRRPKR